MVENILVDQLVVDIKFKNGKAKCITFLIGEIKLFLLNPF